jgi:hypothetical protein
MIVDARYVGNHAVKMLRQDRLILGNNVGYYAYNASNSTYNALQFDVSRRISRNLQFQANYTYSKALTDAGRISAAIFDPYRDQNNHSIDKSYAPFDLPHTFKANVIYDLPFGRDMSGLMKAVVGGWSISGIAIAQSGTRFSILGSNGTSTATTLVGGSQLYNAIHFSETPNGPSIIGASATNLNENSNFFGTGLGNFGGQVFFDTAPGLPGTLPLRAFSGPASFDLDLGIQKSFRITERQRLELRGIAVNVLNHPSFYFGDQNIGLSTFGLQNRGTLYQPRTVQLSAYYRF